MSLKLAGRSMRKTCQAPGTFASLPERSFLLGGEEMDEFPDVSADAGHIVGPVNGVAQAWLTLP